MGKRIFQKYGLSLVFFCTVWGAGYGLAQGQNSSQKQAAQASPENEINVQGEHHEDPSCPISVHKGRIIGASHGAHTKYLPSVNIPYRERFTFFSVADGEKTYLVRRQGTLHVKDYVGVIVTSPCHQSVAEVAQIGALARQDLE